MALDGMEARQLVELAVGNRAILLRIEKRITLLEESIKGEGWRRAENQAAGHVVELDYSQSYEAGAEESHTVGGQQNASKRKRRSNRCREFPDTSTGASADVAIPDFQLKIEPELEATSFQSDDVRLEDRCPASDQVLDQDAGLEANFVRQMDWKQEMAECNEDDMEKTSEQDLATKPSQATDDSCSRPAIAALEDLLTSGRYSEGSSNFDQTAINTVRDTLDVFPHKCGICLVTFATEAELKACLDFHAQCDGDCSSSAGQGSRNWTGGTHGVTKAGQVKKPHVRRIIYQCEICSRKFNHKGAWKLHLRIHQGEKQYMCEFCNKRFVQKGNMVCHINAVHLRQKPHACPICGRKFLRRDRMERHQILIHKVHPSTFTRSDNHKD